MTDPKVPYLPRRNPYEICFAIFVFVFTLPSLLGLTPLPASLQSSTAGLFGHLVLRILTVGCAILILGNTWPRPADPAKISVTAILIERLGLIVSIGGCVCYGFAVAAATGWKGAPALGFVVGFAVASLFVVDRINQAIWDLDPTKGPRRRGQVLCRIRRARKVPR